MEALPAAALLKQPLQLLLWSKPPLPAAAASTFVFLLASVMKRGGIAEPATVLWKVICSMRQGGSISASEAEDSSNCEDDLPDQPEVHGAFTLTSSQVHGARCTISLRLANTPIHQRSMNYFPGFSKRLDEETSELPEDHEDNAPQR